MRTIFWVAISTLPLLAQGGFNGPGLYEIRNIQSGRVIDLDRNDQRTVIQFESRNTDNQTWEAVPADNGYFFLRNGMNGYALTSSGRGNSSPLFGAPFNGSPDQMWRIDPGKDGNAMLISRSNMAVDVPDGTDKNGTRLQIYEANGDANQRFTFQSVGGRGGSWGRGTRRGGDFGRQNQYPNQYPNQAPNQYPNQAPNQGTVVCASNNGERVYCGADTRNGVVLTRQISGTECRQGSTWGFDNRGIWVDRGCRAEFTVGGAYGNGNYGNRPLDDRYRAQTITCASDDGRRNYCQVDLRGSTVRMTRQINGSQCREGRTWGTDQRGIWVDRGCRAEFVVEPRR